MARFATAAASTGAPTAIAMPGPGEAVGCVRALLESAGETTEAGHRMEPAWISEHRVEASTRPPVPPASAIALIRSARTPATLTAGPGPQRLD